MFTPKTPVNTSATQVGRLSDNLKLNAFARDYDFAIMMMLKRNILMDMCKQAHHQLWSSKYVRICLNVIVITMIKMLSFEVSQSLSRRQKVELVLIFFCFFCFCALVPFKYHFHRLSHTKKLFSIQPNHPKNEIIPTQVGREVKKIYFQHFATQVKVTILWTGALALWLQEEETHAPKVASSNPRTVYWMDIFSHTYLL